MTTRFDIVETGLTGLLVLVRKPISDDRGFLERLYCSRELEPVFRGRSIAQVNRTLTQRVGSVRGLHFQRPPHAELKVVSCVRGSVFDVAVDLRRGSPTFLTWHGRVLSAENRQTYVIPEGFAHGFQTLEPDSELLYLHSHHYTPAFESGYNPLDARLSITWPLEVSAISDRDARLPPIEPHFEGLTL